MPDIDHRRQHFPQEIVDQIIDHVAEDHRALKSCALVSSSFSALTRRHLFHSLRICFKPHRIATVKNMPPSVAPLVKWLRIEQFLGDDDSGELDQQVVEIIHGLVNVTRVWIVGPGRHSRAETNLHNPDILRECCKRTITHLVISHSHMCTPEVLQHCTSLQHLSLNFLSFPELMQDTELSTTPRSIQLKSLYLRESSHLVQDAGNVAVKFFKHDNCPFLLTALESIEIYAAWWLTYASMFSFIINLPLGNVTSFSITAASGALMLFHPSRGRIPPGLLYDLSRMPRLSQLKMCAPDGSEAQILSWIVEHLDIIPETNELRELDLSFNLDHQCSEQWGVLGTCLSAPKFQALRNFYFRVNVRPKQSKAEPVDLDARKTELHKIFSGALASVNTNVPVKIEILSLRAYPDEESFLTIV